MKKKQALYQVIADSLLEYIKETAMSELPSLHELSIKFSAGICTMEKAVCELERRGVLTCCRGRKTRVLHSDGTESAHKDQPRISEGAEKLLESLRREILDGKRKTGQTLPKVEYLAARMHISHHSITQVFRCLMHEGLIHKSGKKWAVGPSEIKVDISNDSETVLGKDAMVVCVICSRFSDWNEIAQNDRMNVFSFALCDEMEKYHIRMVLCGTDPDENGPISPSGLENVESLINALGNKYLGSIIVPQIYPAQPGVTSSDWMSMLNRAKKPVVWCDINDLRSIRSRNDVPQGMEFYSILQNNSSAVTSVLRTLTGLGHTRIGLPYIQNATESWRPHFSLTRKNLFAQTAANDFLQVRFFPVEMTGDAFQVIDEKNWDARKWTSSLHMMDEFLPRMTGKKNLNGATSVISSRPSRNEILDVMPFMTKLINDNGVTAIVGCNDYYSCQFYVWLSYLNINVPRDLSIISFDNSVLIRPYPIATLDWGYAHMAYCAIHLLVGDIPIAHNSERVLYAKTKLIDRGSIAAPRTREIVV